MDWGAYWSFYVHDLIVGLVAASVCIAVLWVVTYVNRVKRRNGTNTNQ